MNKGFTGNLICTVICCLNLTAPSLAADLTSESRNNATENKVTAHLSGVEYQNSNSHSSVRTDEKTVAEQPVDDPELLAYREQLFAKECTVRLTVQGSPYKEGECILSNSHLSVTLTPYNRYRSNIENMITGEARTEAVEYFCGLIQQTDLINSVEYRFLDEQGNMFKLIQLQKNDCRTQENE